MGVHLVIQFTNFGSFITRFFYDCPWKKRFVHIHVFICIQIWDIYCMSAYKDFVQNTCTHQLCAKQVILKMGNKATGQNSLAFQEATSPLLKFYFFGFLFFMGTWGSFLWTWGSCNNGDGYGGLQIKGSSGDGTIRH